MRVRWSSCQGESPAAIVDAGGPLQRLGRSPVRPILALVNDVERGYFAHERSADRQRVRGAPLLARFEVPGASSSTLACCSPRRSRRRVTREARRDRRGRARDEFMHRSRQ